MNAAFRFDASVSFIATPPASRGEDAESIPYYKMAIDLDPEFAIAYARIGSVYGDLGEFKLAREYMKEAFVRRQHTSEKEKFYVAAHYYSDFTRETDKAIETYKLWTQTYPHDWVPFNNLSTEYQKVGPAEAMIDPARTALALNPNHGLPYAALVQAYRVNTRFAETKAVAQRAIAAHLDGFIVHFNLYMIGFAEGDDLAMQREIAWYKGKPLESWNLNHQVWGAMRLGKIRKARQLFDDCRTSALKHGHKEYASATASDEAQLEAELGNAPQARAKAELALHLLPVSSETQAGAALAFARIGDVERAGQLAAGARKQFPDDIRLIYMVLPAVQAAGELSRNRPAAALEELRGGQQFDFGSSGIVPELIAPYFRGLAYLQLGSLKQAEAEFRKIIDHHGLAPLSLYWTLAHLQLARACAINGDIADSRAAYVTFSRFRKTPITTSPS